MKLLTLLPIFVLLSIIPIYADNVPTYSNVDNNWGWSEQGYTPVRLDATFNFTNPANDWFKCHVVGNIEGHTIHSIRGFISITNSGQNSSQFKNSDIDSFHIFITNSTYGYTEINGRCADINGTIMQHSAMFEHNMIRIGAGHFVTDGKLSQNIVYNLKNLNIYVPQGYHIMIIGYSQNSQTNGFNTMHEQLIAYMS